MHAILWDHSPGSLGQRSRIPAEVMCVVLFGSASREDARGFDFNSGVCIVVSCHGNVFRGRVP